MENIKPGILYLFEYRNCENQISVKDRDSYLKLISLFESNNEVVEFLNTVYEALFSDYGVLRSFYEFDDEDDVTLMYGSSNLDPLPDTNSINNISDLVSVMRKMDKPEYAIEAYLKLGELLENGDKLFEKMCALINIVKAGQISVVCNFDKIPVVEVSNEFIERLLNRMSIDLKNSTAKFIFELMVATKRNKKEGIDVPVNKCVALKNYDNIVVVQESRKGILEQIEKEGGKLTINHVALASAKSFGYGKVYALYDMIRVNGRIKLFNILKRTAAKINNGVFASV